MNESQWKQVVFLEEKDQRAHIADLVAGGMRLAVIDASFPEETIQRLKEDVKAVFIQYNTPIGLMLYLTPEHRQMPMEEYQYILLSGFQPDEAKTIMSSISTKSTFLVEEPLNPDHWCGVVDGIITKDKALVKSFRFSFSIILLKGITNPLGDGCLWPKGTVPKLLASAPKEVPFSMALLSSAQQLIQQNDVAVNACKVVADAVACNAAAIVLFTADGENIAPVTRLYPPMPVIVVGKRPQTESLLLRQTMVYGVLPTAITNMPENKTDVVSFARWVAGLYGMSPQAPLAIAGHWLAEENQTYCIINMNS